MSGANALALSFEVAFDFYDSTLETREKERISSCSMSSLHVLFANSFSPLISWNAKVLAKTAKELSQQVDK